MKTLYPATVLGSLLLVLCGCNALPLSKSAREAKQQRTVQFDKAWEAMQIVFKRYYSVKSTHPGVGQIIAVTVPEVTTFTKTRQKIIGELIEDGYGGYEIEVRVMNQIEASLADPFSERRQSYDWKTIDFDETLEARLVQEIYREVEGPKEAGVRPAPSAENASARRSPTPPMPRPDESKISEPGPVDSRPGASSHLAFVPRKVSIKDPFVRALVLGDMHFKEGNFAGAEEQYQIAQGKETADPIPWFALGHARFAMGKYDEAAQALRHGLSGYKDWPKVKMDRRSFYGRPEQFHDQLLRLEKWVQERSEDASGHFLLGYNYYFSGRTSLALKSFQKALELNPGDEHAKLFLKQLDPDQVI